VDVLVGARIWERSGETDVVSFPSGVIREAVRERFESARSVAARNGIDQRRALFDARLADLDGEIESH